MGRAIRYGGSALRYRAMVTASSLGLVRSHTDYQRFVIVGSGRSGTNLLRGLLASHPAVLAHGELFRDFERPPGGLPRILQSRAAWRRKRRDPIEFLEGAVFRSLPVWVRAVGFKLFVRHARQPEWLPVWEHIAADDDLVVIHMTRRDRLASLVSLRLAEQAGQWVNTPLKGRIHLDPAECERTFRDMEEADRVLLRRFEGQRVTGVAYEDLCTDTEAVLADLQDRLGLETRRLVPATARQTSGPPHEIVENYEELRAHFSGSRWASLFPV